MQSVKLVIGNEQGDTTVTRCTVLVISQSLDIRDDIDLNKQDPETTKAHAGGM